MFYIVSHDTIIIKTYVYKGECILMSYGKISAKQKEILEYIKQSILSHGYPPAVREICEAVHLKSTSSVHSHLETLEKNGYIIERKYYDKQTKSLFKKPGDDNGPYFPDWKSISYSRSN